VPLTLDVFICFEPVSVLPMAWVPDGHLAVNMPGCRHNGMPCHPQPHVSLQCRTEDGAMPLQVLLTAWMMANSVKFSSSAHVIS